jgi:hypothetical protein
MDSQFKRTNKEMEMRGVHDKDQEQSETEVDLVYDLLKVLFAAVMLCLVIAPMIKDLSAFKKQNLPCDVAEISPDFSPSDREKCRMIRGHKL